MSGNLKLIVLTIEPENNKVRNWLKRVGVVGFLFFLIKGLIWLAILFFGLKTCGSTTEKAAPDQQVETSSENIIEARLDYLFF
jgi:hypothetical protein